MTPPPDLAGQSVRRPTQTQIERPETPPRVRAELVEGRAHYMRLEAEVKEMRVDMREDAKEMREALRDHERLNAQREKELRAEITDVRGEVRAVGVKVDKLDDRLDRMEQLMVAHLRPPDGSTIPTTQPSLPAFPLASPLTSAGQARRAAAVGGGGVTLAGGLGVLASLGSLPAPLQWALGVLAVAVGLAAVAVATRWGWRAAGR